MTNPFADIAEGLKQKSEGFWTYPAPTFEEYVNHRNFLGQPPLFERQARVFKEALGDDPKEYFSNNKVVDLIVAEWGKGSGKDLVVSYFLSYCAYLLNAMEDPRAYLGLAPDDPIEILTVAASQKQSTTILFYKLTKWIGRPCFEKFSPQINASDIYFPNGVRLFRLSLESGHIRRLQSNSLGYGRVQRIC